MRRIDKKTYKATEDNHYKPNLPKTQIVLGLSLRIDHNHLIRLKNKEFKKSKKWNTFTISRDGKIYQHFDDNQHSDFIGMKSADKNLISIVLENMGCLYKLNDILYVNSLNEVCDNKNVVYKKWFEYEYWENFTDEQYKSLIDLIKRLTKKHNIHQRVIPFHYYHDETNKYKGVVFRSNYIDNSVDMSPIFNIKKMKKDLGDESI